MSGILQVPSLWLHISAILRECYSLCHLHGPPMYLEKHTSTPPQQFKSCSLSKPTTDPTTSQLYTGKVQPPLQVIQGTDNLKPTSLQVYLCQSVSHLISQMLGSSQYTTMSALW